jgi:transposase
MTQPFSLGFKQKMVERLTGGDAVSARQLGFETGISQQTLSRWLHEACSLSLMPPKPTRKAWSIDEKIRILAEASGLTGAERTALLTREAVPLGEFEEWRLALAEESGPSRVLTRRLRQLERELARKEKALAEAAALLILKKKVAHLWAGEDDAIGKEPEP